MELIDRILSDENIKAAIHADEHPMTASGGNVIGCEIRRNKQSPHEVELRRLSLRTRATKVRRVLTTHEDIFKVANSRLGWYRRCGMDVVNYLLSPKVLTIPNKKENRPGLIDPLAYYLGNT